MEWTNYILHWSCYSWNTALNSDSLYKIKYMRENQKNPEFVYKKLCIYFHMIKLQSFSKYSLFDARHLFEALSPLL